MKDEKEVEELYTRGMRFEQFGELNAAEEALTKVVEMDSSHAKAWLLLGRVYVRAEKFKQARQCIRKAIQIDPHWIEPLGRLGLLEFILGRFDEAIKPLRRYFRLDGTDVDALIALAESEARLGNCEAVIEVSTKVVGLDPESAEAWVLRGMCERKLGNSESALTSLGMALELNPEQIDVLNTLGNLHYDAERYKDAQEYFKKSLSLDGSQASIVFMYATAQWFIGQWGAALEGLETYTKMNPDDPKGWNNLGVVYREKGDVSAARECYKKALLLDADFQVARENLDDSTKQAVP